MKKYLTNIKKGIFIKESNISEKKFKYHERCVIKIYQENIISSFLGLGGALTESTAYNYQKLSRENQERFIKDYYSSSGLNYQFGRIAIGSNDFALKHFEYTKKADLSDFSIEHDKKYTIPFILDVLKTKNISLIASPWSPPKVLKTIKTPYIGAKLNKDNYEIYSEYLIKFIKAYENLGINIDYLTMQNEPFARQPWESCKFELSEQKEFIYQYLLPKLDKTKVLLWDHNKEMLYDNFKYLYEKNKKIAGIGFHYYSGSHFNNIRMIRKEYPNTLLINTEMCCGYSKYDETKWISDAEWYMKDLIGDLNSGINAYLDWNMLLDERGGPTHSFNFLKSPIILKEDSYIKTPIYYYLYHLSHFIDSGEIIEHSTYTNDLEIVSIKNSEKIVVVIVNNKNKEYKYKLFFNNDFISDSIPAHSIITYVKK